MAASLTQSDSPLPFSDRTEPERYRFLLLHALVTIVLSYQLLFSPEPILSPEAQESIVLLLMLSIAGLVMLPAGSWARGPVISTVVLGDTAITSLIIYYSGNATSDLYLAYFLIILIAAFGPSLRHIIAFACVLCLAYAGLLFLQFQQTGTIHEGQLLRIPALLILGVFYGLAIETVRRQSRSVSDLTIHLHEHERMAEALRESQRTLSTLMRNLPGMVYRCRNDEDWSMLFTNDGCLNLTGYHPRDLIEKKVNYAQLIHPDDRRRMWDGAQEGIRARKPYQLTYRIRTARGEEKWVWEQGQGVFDAEDRLQFLEGFITDITSQKQAQQTLKSSRDYYLRLLDEFPTPIWKSGVDGKCDYFNRSWLAFTGRVMEQELGDGWAEGVHSGDLDHCLRTYHRAFEAKQTFQMEYRLRRHDGTYGWILDIGRPYYDLHGTFAGFLGTCFDLSGRKEAERARVMAEERFQAFMDNNPAIAFIKDAEGRYVYVNKPYEETLKQNKNDWEGKTDFDLWPPEIAEQFSEHDRAVLESGKPRQFEELAPMPGFGAKSFLVLKFPLCDASGNVFLGGMAFDITERRQLEHQLRQAQKMEAVGQLAGGIAHDFNNLLTVIMGCSQMLLDRLDDGTAAYSELEEIMKASTRAASLTQQLLAFSRRQMLQPKVLNLNTVVTTTGNMLERVIGEDIHLLTVLASDLGRVKVDQGQLEQVIMNLAVNARDAMPQGGTLTIETMKIDLPEGLNKGRVTMAPGSYVGLAVKDTGQGMTEHVLSRIFDPFFTTKEQGKGTGLGLSTVYGIIKQSEGYIFAESQPGAGTTFLVYLPCVNTSTDASVDDPNGQSIRGGSETILVAEDEGGLRVLIRRILENHGYTVLEAETGPGALTVAEGHHGPIHMLLTDVVMPGGMYGRELAERLAATRPKIRVLYITGYTDEALIRHGILERQVDLLQKPFSRENLARQVRASLDAPARTTPPSSHPN